MEEVKTKKTGKKVLSAGALVMDIIPVFEEDSNERTAAGGTVYLKKIDTAIGGSVGNTGLTLKRLGADVTVFSKVGDDSLGMLVREAVERTGCPYYLKTTSGEKSSVSIIVASPGQDRMILHSRGASQIYKVEDIPEDLLRKNDLFHFGYPTGMECMYSDNGELLSEFYQRVKRFGLTTSMDISFPGIDTPSGLSDWRGILKKTLPYVDIFLPSFEEIFLILHREEYLEIRKEYPDMKLEDIFSMDRVRRIAGELLDMGTKIAVIKCGSMGAYVKTGSKNTLKDFGRAAENVLENWADKELFSTPFSVKKLISTNGAGDTFVSGFLMGILLGRNAEETLKFASAAATVRIMSPMGRDSIPDYKIIDQISENELALMSAKTIGIKLTEDWITDKKTGVLFCICRRN